MAHTLKVLAILHSLKEEYSQAQPLQEEALQIYRQLAILSPQLFLTKVLMVLNNIVAMSLATNELNRTHSLHEESLHIRKQLESTDIDPLIFLPDLGTSLNNLAVLYLASNEFSQAQTLYEEALQIRRKLAEIKPQIYLSYLMATAMNLAIFYKEYNENKQISLFYCKEVLRAALLFVVLPPDIESYTRSTLQIVYDWGVNAEGFLQEVITEQGS